MQQVNSVPPDPFITTTIKTDHCDARTSAGIHIGNLTHQDVAIFGAGAGQGTTFYGQVNGTSLVLSGAASCTALTAAGSVVVDPAAFDRPSGVVIRRRYDTDAWHNLNLFAGWANFDYHYTGVDDGNWRWNYAQDGTTFTTLMQLTKDALVVNTNISCIGGSVPGTPGATDVLFGGGAGKFGGAVSCTELTATNSVTVNTNIILATTSGYQGCFLTGGQSLTTTTGIYSAVGDKTLYLNGVSGINFRIGGTDLLYFTSTPPGVISATEIAFGSGAGKFGSSLTCTSLTATTGDIVGPKVKLTTEGGIATLVVADEAISVGHVCAIIQGGTANRVKKCPTTGNENDMPVGVAYSAAGAAGDSFWMVVSGRVGVLPDSAATAAQGYILYTSATTAGLATQTATAPAAATHFKEIGHFINTGSGAGVITDAIVHFN